MYYSELDVMLAQVIQREKERNIAHHLFVQQALRGCNHLSLSGRVAQTCRQVWRRFGR